VARTPPDRTLDWVLGVIGAGARIVESRTLHGDEPPWQLRIEHSAIGARVTGTVVGYSGDQLRLTQREG
jgi:hypothetical protein